MTSAALETTTVQTTHLRPLVIICITRRGSSIALASAEVTRNRSPTSALKKDLQCRHAVAIRLATSTGDGDIANRLASSLRKSSTCRVRAPYRKINLGNAARKVQRAQGLMQ